MNKSEKTIWAQELGKLLTDAGESPNTIRQMMADLEEVEHDPVYHPEHYTSHPSGVECIEITRHMGFNLGNAMKYIWRDGIKYSEAPLEDLRKAIWYIQDEIAMREEE